MLDLYECLLEKAQAEQDEPKESNYTFRIANTALNRIEDFSLITNEKTTEWFCQKVIC